MSAPREWKLVLTCPACKRAGEVSAAKMEAVISCPHCHTRVVIARDGIHDAAKHRRKTERERKQRSEDHTYHYAGNYSSRHAWFWGALPGLVLIALIPLAFRIRGNVTYNPDGKLYAAVREFQSAWLNNDLETAGTFVVSNDRVRFEIWSAPRRAALVAGFGSKFRSRITDVEIIEKTECTAAVRVSFDVAGHEQQAFQDWKFVEGHWRLRFK